MTTRVYLDTEFTKFARPQLISLALVAESGQEFYGESTDFVKVQCSDFVVENVLPLLHGGELAASLDDLRVELGEWLATVPSPAEIISDFSSCCSSCLASVRRRWVATTSPNSPCSTGTL